MPALELLLVDALYSGCCRNKRYEMFGNMLGYVFSIMEMNLMQSPILSTSAVVWLSGHIMHGAKTTEML
jgi:hypothetical protein